MLLENSVDPNRLGKIFRIQTFAYKAYEPIIQMEWLKLRHRYPVSMQPRPTSETPFESRFAGGPIVVCLLLAITV